LKTQSAKVAPLVSGVVAFAFGTPSTIPPNMFIAEIARDASRHLGQPDHRLLPVFTQANVRIESIGQLDIPVEYLSESSRHTPTTLQVARGAVRWAIRQGVNRIIVVAAKPHLRRCMRDLTATIREVGADIEVTYSRAVNKVPLEYWFCADSRQTRTRSWGKWWSREAAMKFMPFFLYRLLSS